MRPAIFVAALLLSACVAETVERKRPRPGPVKEVGYIDHGGGQVRYSTQGWDFVVAGRRRAALHLIGSNCGKELEPKIGDERVHEDADAPFAEADLASNLESGSDHFKIEPHVHIVYECVPREKSK